MASPKKMRVDRHRNIADELEAELMTELEGITTQLRGTMKRSTQNYRGRISKVVTIEYDVQE